MRKLLSKYHTELIVGIIALLTIASGFGLHMFFEWSSGWWQENIVGVCEVENLCYL